MKTRVSLNYFVSYCRVSSLSISVLLIFEMQLINATNKLCLNAKDIFFLSLLFVISPRQQYMLNFNHTNPFLSLIF